MIAHPAGATLRPRQQQLLPQQPVVAEQHTVPQQIWLLPQQPLPQQAAAVLQQWSLLQQARPLAQQVGPQQALLQQWSLLQHCWLLAQQVLPQHKAEPPHRVAQTTSD